MALKAEVFDSRRNVLGEGPTSSGAQNNHVMWVDIYGKAVRWRNLESGEIGEYQTPEDVGFVIPLAEGERATRNRAWTSCPRSCGEFS